METELMGEILLLYIKHIGNGENLELNIFKKPIIHPHKELYSQQLFLSFHSMLNIPLTPDANIICVMYMSYVKDTARMNGHNIDIIDAIRRKGCQ